MNVALLGTGRIADQQLAPALGLARDARLWSVLSRRKERAEAFAAAHAAEGAEPAHSGLQALLADPDLDAVLIATPDGLHADQAVAAAKAGKHVLVEKPMATSVADARRMVDACDEAAVTLAVAYHLRWHGGHRRVEALIRGGEVGTLRHMRAQWTFAAPNASDWRAHDEVARWWSLAGVGTHCLDLIRWFMGPDCGEITRIDGVTAQHVWGGPHDEMAMVTMTFESGATAEFTSASTFRSPSRFEVYGTDGFIIGTGTLGPHGAGRIECNGQSLTYEGSNPYLGEIEDFVGAVWEGRPAAVDGIEGTRNVELLEAIGA